jgi:hypothetical protein
MPQSSNQNWPALFYLIVLSCPLAAGGQERPISQMPAPPPMKFVSRDERSQLTAARDAKSRVKLAVELAEGHLASAEQLTQQKKFESALEELGSYLGLIDDALDFIGELNPDKNSTRDLYRHVETNLRRHLPRLAVMRRITPAEYAMNIKAAEEHARDARAEALDSFYGHTVFREGTNEKKSSKPNEHPEENKRP